MKLKILSVAILLVFVLSACKKDRFGKDKFELSICETDEFNNPDIIPENMEQHILKPLVIDPNCGCIVGGFVKYVDSELNETVALVKYEGGMKEGTCYGWGLKVLCEDGDCDKFEEKMMERGDFEADHEEERHKKKKGWWKKKKKKKGCHQDDFRSKWCKFEQDCQLPSDASTLEQEDTRSEIIMD